MGPGRHPKKLNDFNLAGVYNQITRPEPRQNHKILKLLPFPAYPFIQRRRRPRSIRIALYSRLEKWTPPLHYLEVSP